MRLLTSLGAVLFCAATAVPAIAAPTASMQAVTATTAASSRLEVAGRKGSKRVGGKNSKGKGGHYVGGRKSK